MPELTIKAKLSLYKKSQQSGIDIGTLEEVYSRGYNSWSLNDTCTPQQLGFDRVNSFISGGEAIYLDQDLYEEVANGEKITKNKKDPSSRFVGSNALVSNLKKETPGEIPVIKFTKAQIEKRITNEELRMFSEKNYGLPKDLVDVVRAVLEGKKPEVKEPGKGAKPDDEKTKKDEKQDEDKGIVNKKNDGDNDEDDTEDNAENGSEKTELSGEKTPVNLNPKTDDNPDGAEKTIKPKKTADANVKEEINPLIAATLSVLNRDTRAIVIDEISKKLAGSYLDKAGPDFTSSSEKASRGKSLSNFASKMKTTGDPGGHTEKHYSAVERVAGGIAKKHAEHSDKRFKGILNAGKKLSGTAKVNAKEEVEFSTENQLDELTKNSLHSYIQGAMGDMADHSYHLGVRAKSKSRNKEKYDDEAEDKMNRRESGVALALQKIKGKGYGARVPASEEVSFSDEELANLNAIAQENQLDEISKDLAGRYAVKALADRHKQSFKHDAASDKAYKSSKGYSRVKALGPDRDYGETDANHQERLDRLKRRQAGAEKDQKDALKKIHNRNRGLTYAGKRLAKEEIEDQKKKFD